MMIVDSHCHAGTSWFEPIELLLYQMDANDIDRGVLIQHRGMYDSDYLLESAERFPGRFSVVVIVDTSSPDAPSALGEWARRGAVGVRLAPDARSAGPDPLAIWRKAAELGLAVSSIGTLDAFASEEFSALVSERPDMPIVIEHLAGATPADEPPYPAFERAMELANAPNTYIKVGGLGEIAERPAPLRNEFRFHDVPPLVEMARDAFGPRRMMWGSDYPPVSGREGYRNALRGVMDHPAFRTDEDREWVMGRTASEVFFR